MENAPLFNRPHLPYVTTDMLIEFGDAFDFTAADFFGWCREVGFRETEVIAGQRRRRLQVNARTPRQSLHTRRQK